MKTLQRSLVSVLKLQRRFEGRCFEVRGRQRKTWTRFISYCNNFRLLFKSTSKTNNPDERSVMQCNAGVIQCNVIWCNYADNWRGYFRGYFRGKLSEPATAGENEGHVRYVELIDIGATEGRYTEIRPSHHHSNSTPRNIVGSILSTPEGWPALLAKHNSDFRLIASPYSANY